MATRKTAISLPEEVLNAVDHAARERGESRSRFITRVLRAALSARRDEEVRRRLDELFADPELDAEQGRTADQLDAAAGDDWAERW